MSISSIMRLELREHRSWFIGWISSITILSLFIVTMYPGDEGMRSMIKLLSDSLYQAFLGHIQGNNPSYLLWNSMISPFASIIFLSFAILSGIRISMTSISNKTSEIIYTMPISRSKSLFAKFLAMLIYAFFVILAWFIPLLIPINGNYLEIKLVNKLISWAFIFVLMGIMCGTLLANVVGSAKKANQNFTFIIIFFYVMEVTTNLFKVQLNKTEIYNNYTLYNLIKDINPMEWYNISGVILGDNIDNKYIWIILISSFILCIIAFITNNLRDMIDERGLINLSINLRKNKNAKHKNSIKKSVYVFWVKPLEKKFPILADQIYSDRRALMILFIVIITIWPMQLMLYPGDISANLAAQSLMSGGIINIVSYGYNLSHYPPWAWWLITQALGTHWILTFMVIRWIRAIPSRDSEDGTGELIGAQPIKKEDVIIQRILAIFLELMWIAIWLIVWYLLSIALIESRVGSVITPANPINGTQKEIFQFNNPLDTTWVIIAIIMMIPLYMFLVISGVFINLSFKEKGLTIAKIYIYALFLMFIIPLMSAKSDLYWLTGIYGMYNPVAIVLEQSLKTPSYGTIVLIILTIIILPLYKLLNKNLTWLK